MLSMNDLKIGVVIVFMGEPWVVHSAQHVQMGRGSAVVRTKIKNFINGRVQEQTFKGGDKIESADLARFKAQFLYPENDHFVFMDTESYDTIALHRDIIGPISNFIKEGQDIELLRFRGKPISVSLPKKVELKVVETEPGARGDTAQGSVIKSAKLETGLTLSVPLFIKTGDVIRVNTDTGLYVERA